jgi:hypothetical protein
MSDYRKRWMEDREKAFRQQEGMMSQLENKTQAMKDKRLAEIQGHTDKIKAEVQKLRSERDALLKAPINKEDLLQQAKKTVESRREEIIQFLAVHFKECQGNHDLLFNDISMRNHRLGLGPEDVWKLLFLCITDEGIERAISTLPDIGLRSGEREAQLKKIDNRVNKLLKDLDSEL